MGGWGVLLLMIVATVVVVVGIPIVVAITLAARRRRIDRSSPRVQVEARVVDKRSLITGAGDSASDQRQFVTFQFPNGNRLELAVPASQAGILIVGDEGQLDWQGRTYLGFAREILR
ncbi:MAG: DUF2500 domain-containing protein [Propionibacteriaceae bacterium]|jgi:hypothetical protein|nr:DUF2500 domain-containing protein [Propionibacteriaceae bacterium]